MGHLLVPLTAHSISLQYAGELRIHPSDSSAVTSSDSGQLLFRTAVLESFNTRMQACHDDVTRDALRQLADKFQQVDVLTPLAGILDSEKSDVPVSKSVDRFILKLIQNRIHQLDSRISQRLQLTMPANKGPVQPFSLGSRKVVLRL